MRKAVWIWICLAALSGISPVLAGPQKPSAGEEFAGTWGGTWEGGGGDGGGLELTLEKGKDAAMAGRVSVTGEPTYKAPIKTLAFDGKKMTATYDFPPDPAVQVRITATFEGTRLTGTWAALDAGGGELAAGTWKADKK